MAKSTPQALLPILTGALLLVASACGGSASETPWPVEPDNVDLGPVGESRAEEEGTARPGSSSAPSDRREPAMEDETIAPQRKTPPAPTATESAQPLAP
jgi:hypothetical protein